MKLSVVIPVFNEAATIQEIVQAVQNVDMDKEIVIVDDGSTDGTREKLEALATEHPENLSVLYQDKNMGKGAALRRGFQKVTGDIVVVQDADLEYDPADYARLIKPILEGRADVVLGSRFLGGGTQRVLFFWHSVANKLLTLLCSAVTNLNLSDMESCYKMFRREVLDDLPLRANRFGFEPEFVIKVARRGWRVYEVPISYHGRKYEEGKKINWKDGVAAIYFILRFALFD